MDSPETSTTLDTPDTGQIQTKQENPANKAMSNTDPTKKRSWDQVLAKGYQDPWFKVLLHCLYIMKFVLFFQNKIKSIKNRTLMYF